MFFFFKYLVFNVHDDQYAIIWDMFLFQDCSVIEKIKHLREVTTTCNTCNHLALQLLFRFLATGDKLHINFLLIFKAAFVYMGAKWCVFYKVAHVDKIWRLVVPSQKLAPNKQFEGWVILYVLDCTQFWKKKSKLMLWESAVSLTVINLNNLIGIFIWQQVLAHYLAIL